MTNSDTIGRSAKSILLTPSYGSYRLLWAGLVISGLGNGLRTVSSVFVVLAVGGDVIDIGLVLAAAAIPSVMLGLFGGVLVDRLSGKPFLLIADAGRAAALGTLAIFLVTETATIWIVVVLNVAYGIFDSLFQPALNSVLPRTVSKVDLQRANAAMDFGSTATYLIGMGIGGALVSLIGVGSAVTIDAISFAVSFVLLAAMRVATESKAPDEAPESFLSELRKGWVTILERKWMLTEMLRSTIEFPLVVAPFFILGPLIADERLDGGASWAVILIAFTVGMLIGSAVAGRVRPRRPMLVCTILMAFGAVSPLALAFSDSTLLIAGAEGLKGAFVGFFSAIWATLMQSKVPENVRGRVGAWDYTLSTGLTPIGFLIAGPLAAAFGATEVLVVASAVVLLGVAIQLLVPSVRRLQW